MWILSLESKEKEWAPIGPTPNGSMDGNDERDEPTRVKWEERRRVNKRKL